MSILKTDNLTDRYSVGTPFEVTALENVSLEVEKGDESAIDNLIDSMPDNNIDDIDF